MRLLPIFFLALAAITARADDSPLARAAAWLTGHFTNEAQFTYDRGFRHVELHAVPLFPDRTDGPWLYVEQSLNEAPALPYRQRVHQLAARADGSIEVRVYILGNPVAFTAAWQHPARLAKLAHTDLVFQEGCTIVLREQPDGSFKGVTEGSGCTNDLNNAAYATSDLSVTKDQIATWERGYNAAKVQVWGPLGGGYIFKRSDPTTR